MKRYRISDLGPVQGEHVAEGIVPGRYIHQGGLSFHPPGWRTHAEGNHRHDSHEVFVILQGRGEIEINGRRQPIEAGDVLVIEPGEEHYLIGDPAHPIINLWFHCADEPHPNQRPNSEGI